jgi:sigma-B regulation protein RsbQ
MKIHGADADTSPMRACGRQVEPAQRWSDERRRVSMVQLRHAAIPRHTVEGEGDHTVVFGNGFGTGQDIWRHQVAALRERCRVVRFDYGGVPGTDPSSFCFERYATLYGFADDLLALLDSLDIRGATFVGHSVSAMVGAIAAVAEPERIDRLVMVAGSPCYIDEPGYRGGFSREAIDALLRAVATEYHGWVGGFSPAIVGDARMPEVTDAFASYLRRMRPDVTHAMLHTIFHADMRRLLPRVAQPVLVIQPAVDVAVPVEVGHYLAEHLPDAVLRVVDSAGHLPHVTRADEVTAMIAAHLPG